MDRLPLPLAFITAAIAFIDVIMMSTITITTTLTTIVMAKIQLVCVNPFMAVEV